MSHEIEKAIVAALEPVIDMVVALEKQVESLPPVVAVDPAVVATAVFEKYGDELRGAPGTNGEPGADAPIVTVQDVAKELALEHSAYLRGDKGEDGANGADGTDGTDGADVDPETVAAKLFELHGEDLRGAPGADAPVITATDVAAVLVEAHSDALRGAPGEKGDRGPMADVPSAQAIAKVLVDEHKQDLRGETGASGLGLETKAYVEGSVHREGVFVTAHLGQNFKALRDTAAVPGESDDWERVGSAGFRLTGPYDADKNYQDGDLYIKDFGCFLHAGGKSTLLAGRGAKGERGLRGDNGADGKNGSSVIAGEQVGFKLHLMFCNDDGPEVDTITYDLESVVMDAVKAEREGLLVAVERVVKDIVDGAVHNKLYEHPADERATPIKFYRGLWQAGGTYYEGDVTVYGNVTYVCTVKKSVGDSPRPSVLENSSGGSKSWRSLLASAGNGGAIKSDAATVTQLRTLTIASLVPGFLTEYNITDPAYPYFEEQNFPFRLERLDATNYRMLATGPLIFPGTFGAEDNVISFPQRDVPLSTINVGSSDGIFILYVGIKIDGTLHYSSDSLSTSLNEVQLGVMSIKRVGGVISFLDELVVSPIRTQPNVAGIDNLQRTMTPLGASVYAAPDGASLRIKTTGGFIAGECLAWGDVSNAHQIPVPAQAIRSFYRIDGGSMSRTTLGGLQTLLVPTNYWNGTALVALAANGNASVQRVMVTATGGVLIQYGERQYTNLQDAIDDTDNAPFTALFPAAFAVEIARIAVVKTCTALNNNAEAVMRRAMPRIGGGLV